MVKHWIMLELKVLLDDGSIIHCTDVSGKELEQKLELKIEKETCIGRFSALSMNNKARLFKGFQKSCGG